MCVFFIGTVYASAHDPVSVCVHVILCACDFVCMCVFFIGTVYASAHDPVSVCVHVILCACACSLLALCTQVLMIL